jgi:hypothetical protein
MKIYLGIVGSKKVQAFAKQHDCGWCLTPENNRKIPHGTYFLDNGAFTAWKNKTRWDEVAFKILVNKYPNYDFVVAPDIVGVLSHLNILTIMRGKYRHQFILQFKMV